MKSTAKKLITFLLSLVMIVSLVPYTAFASGDYSDGQTCPGCDHYHWGDRMCDNCGGCTEDCTDFCWLGMHCNNCGACLLDSVESCLECGYCFDCMMEHNHCAECYADYIGNGDQLCGNCRRCPDCVGELCPDCGFCVDCANDEEGMHCPECGNCYQTTDQCEDITNNHCIDCCNPCEQCGKCMFDAADEICPDCGLCQECCVSNSENSGGTGEVCIESSDWDDHICSDCGEYFELDDLCASCGSAGVIRCAGCCESASECSIGMCEYTSEYEEHFCENCGRCFDDAAACDTCLDENIRRCEDCCAEASEAEYGCDDGLCQFSADFVDHINSAHSGHINKHSATPSNRWSIEPGYHYRACRYCSDTAHYTGKAAHSFDKAGICTVCGYKNGASIYITRQPSDVTVRVSDLYADSQSRYNIANNVARFSIRAAGNCTLSYIWHVVFEYPNGETADYSADDWADLNKDEKSGAVVEGYYTNTFSLSVPYNACRQNFYVYCVVYDKASGDKVTSEWADLNADHTYTKAIKAVVDDDQDNTFTDRFSGKSFTYVHSSGHYLYCVGCYNSGMSIDKLPRRSTKPVSHSFGATSFKTSDTGEKYRVATCSDCGFEQYTSVHDHQYYEDDGRYCKPDYEATEKVAAYGHVLKCLTTDCPQTITEPHDWGWKIVSWPKEGSKSGMRRECKICLYSEDYVYAYDESNNKVPLDWTMTTSLVEVSGADVSKPIVAADEKIFLTVNHAGNATPKKCTTWKVYYQATLGAAREDITAYYYKRVEFGGRPVKLFQIEAVDGGTKWRVNQVKLPSGVTGGGKLIFEPVWADCTEHDPVVINQKDPVCSVDGYTGDTVCRLCNTVISKGTDIPATGQHRRSDEPIAGTAREGSCTRRSYSGNYTCLDCGSVLRGESGGYYHKNVCASGDKIPKCQEGYVGDQVCVDCGKIAKKGYVLPACHNKTFDKSTVVPATCTIQGYSGDYVCKDCGKLLEHGQATAKLGHSWVENTGASTASTVAYKCSNAGCNAVRYACKSMADAKLTASYLTSTGKPYLKWDAVAGADSYSVYRSGTKDGAYTLLGTTTATNYTDSKANAGYTYYYKIRAVATDGTKSDSSAAVAVTCHCARPTVKADYLTSTGKPYIKWDAVAGASKYEVYRSGSKDGTYTLLGTTTATNYTDNKANAGYTYYYKVKAISKVKTAANSYYSIAVAGTCHCAKPVVTPDYLASTGKPYIKWTAVAGASKYEVYRSGSKDGTYTLLGTTTATNYTDSKANAGYTYYYKVKAVSKVKTAANSYYSAAVAAICHCARPSVQITTASAGKPRLTWNAVAGASQYEIYRATSQNGTYTKMYTTTALSYTNTSAKAGTTYYYKVKAISKVKSAANSSFSTVVSIKVK